MKNDVEVGMNAQVRIHRGFPVTCNHSRVHGRSSHSGLSATVKVHSWASTFHPRRRSRLSATLRFYANSRGTYVQHCDPRTLSCSAFFFCFLPSTSMQMQCTYIILFLCFYLFNIAVEVGKCCVRMLLHFLPPHHPILRKLHPIIPGISKLTF